MAAMAAAAPNRRWPDAIRLAAPPQPVVAVFEELAELDATWRAAFERSVTALEAAGARIVRIDGRPFLAAARLLYDGALVAERYAAVGDFVDQHPAAVDPTVRAIIQGARGIPAHQLVDDIAELSRLTAVGMEKLGSADALMLPTAPFHPTIAEVQADPVAVNSRLGTYTNFCNLFDMCAVAVPAGMAGAAQFGVTVYGRAFDDAVVLDIAALLQQQQAPESAWPLFAADTTELVVFGAHLRGQPLEHQLTDLGARWAGAVTTAPHYRLGVLDTTPPKPAVTRCADDERGVSVLGERWLLSPAALGRFLQTLPAPMQLGTVEFADGSWRTAFGCDAAAAAAAKDISEYGGWRAALQAGCV
jgi:allophanate hydrolase